MDDGKNIFNHLSFIRQVTSVENHEVAIFLLTEPFDKVKTKPDKSVFVADHNFSDVSWQNLSQKGKKSFAPVVESWTDFFDKLSVCEQGLQVVSLSLKIWLLLVWTNPGVEDSDSCIAFWIDNGIDIVQLFPEKSRNYR